jgi:hypothetical protein
MDRKHAPSLWRTARVETGTLALLALGWVTASAMGWAPDVNSSLGVLGIYAAWLGLCVIIYRYFYRLDT